MDEDKSQIAEVLIRYATGIDFKDWPLLRTCWTDVIDVDYQQLGHFTSADALTDVMRQLHENMGPTYHRMSNFVIAIDETGDRAIVRSYVHAVLMLQPDDSTNWVDALGHYDDIFVRTPEGWRISERVSRTARTLTGGDLAAAATEGADMTDFVQKYGPWAVIAGASEGIGASLADQLATRGIDLVLIARNGALLEEVATRARDQHGVQTRAVVQDLTAPDMAARMAEATAELDVGLVIYNAGASDRTTTFLDNELDYSLKQIKLDCIGPIALAHHFGTAMRERGRGGIVFVASLACVAGSATLAVYSAVKAFQRNFAEGLWAELRPHGVDVCCTPLGMTYTPAFARMGFQYDPQMHMLSEDVAREIIENIGNGPVHVVGETNRAVASQVWPIDRRSLVEMMSAASLDFASRRAD